MIIYWRDQYIMVNKNNKNRRLLWVYDGLKKWKSWNCKIEIKNKRVR